MDKGRRTRVAWKMPWSTRPGPHDWALITSPIYRTHLIPPGHNTPVVLLYNRHLYLNSIV